MKSLTFSKKGDSHSLFFRKLQTVEDMVKEMFK